MSQPARDRESGNPRPQLSRPRRFLALWGALIALLVVTAAGCGGDSLPGSDIAPATGAPLELVGWLLAPEDLGASWSLWQADPDQSTPPLDPLDGAASTLEDFAACPEAGPDAASAADNSWEAFAVFEMSDSGALFGSGLAEYLLAGEAAQIEATFTVLEDGFVRCLDAHTGGPLVDSVELVGLPEVGDERVAVAVLRGGGTALEASQVIVLVRQGPVLMLAIFGGVSEGGDGLNMDQVRAITAAAVGRIEGA